MEKSLDEVTAIAVTSSPSSISASISLLLSSGSNESNDREVCQW